MGSEIVRHRAEFFAGAIAIGAALRIVALPLPGTTDVPIFKVWAFHAATEGVGRLYGTGGRFPERRLLRFQGIRTKIDYPPIALYELGAAGRVYRRVNGGRFPDTPRLPAAIKTLDLIADAALIWILFLAVRRRLSADA